MLESRFAEVDVHVDHAREQPLAGRVDNVLVGRVEVAADLGDGLATNPDIPLAAVRQRRVRMSIRPSAGRAPKSLG